MMDAIFVRLLDVSVTTSLLVLVIIILKLLFRRLSTRVHCLLWLVVAIRLVCPLYFESTSYYSSETKPKNKPVEERLLVENEQVLRANILVDHIDQGKENVQIPSAEVVERNNIYYDVLHIGGIVWSVGMVVILGYSMISYVKLKFKVRESVRCDDNVWLCDHVNTPFIIGFVKPRIIIPSSVDENSIKYIIAHEMAHLERRDYIWKPLASLFLAVYWMNPVMWLAYILFCRDIEFACDDKVIYCKTDEYVKEYMNTLVECSVPKYKLVSYSVAFGEISVKRRIKRIVAYKRPAIFMAEVIVIAGISLFMSFFVDNPLDKWNNAEKPDYVWEYNQKYWFVRNDYDGEVPSGKCGQKEITYEELIDICMRGEEVYLDDFTEYKYELFDEKMKLPLANYEDMYVHVDYAVFYDGSIGMNIVYLLYEPDDGDTEIFFLDEQMKFYAFTQMEPKYDDRKIYADIVWGTVDENSMIVEVFNETERTYKWNYSYEIYEVIDNEEKLITVYEGDEVNYCSDLLPYTHEIKLDDGVKFEDGKQYLLKYGKNKSGYLYSEITFVK